VLLAAGALGPVAAAQSLVPPEDFKIAFIGDQGLGPGARAVLQLIAEEGADVVVHSGDFDYEDDPEAWDQQITDILGPCFPYFASVGNHDTDAFYGPGGYQEKLLARMDCLGLTWDGDLGVRSSHTYRGVLFVFTAPGVFGDGDADDAPDTRQKLGASDATWRIRSWHKLTRTMQIGGKSDETGWGVYEESRRGGAVIATAHEHSYARTHPLRDCESRIVDGTGAWFTIARDDPASPADEGVTFFHHSGLGGKSIRDQERCLPVDPPYGCNGEWAAVYAQQQGADFGALFGVLNVGGNPRRAHFYFKDVAGNVPDEFHVMTTWGPCCRGDLGGDCTVGVADFLKLLVEWGTDPDGPPDFDYSGAVGVLDLLYLLTHWGPCCRTDLDGDGRVGVTDFLAVLAGWGPNPGHPADFDGDGGVGVTDFLTFLAHWGPCP